MIGDNKVTVLVRGARGPSTFRAHITGPSPPANGWYYGTNWGWRGIIVEADLGVKWLHGWPDVDSGEVKALLVAAALSDSEDVIGAGMRTHAQLFGG